MMPPEASNGKKPFVREKNNFQSRPFSLGSGEFSTFRKPSEFRRAAAADYLPLITSILLGATLATHLCRKVSPRLIKVLLPIALLTCLCLAATIAFSQGTLNPISPAYDWQPQDYHDSQAITNVVYDTNRQCLVAYGRFKGIPDPECSTNNVERGEIYLDLRYATELFTNFPVNLEGTTVHASLVVEDGFNHPMTPSQHPNGMQIFAKSTNWNGQYSEWTNTFPRGFGVTNYTLVHTFTNTSDFDASQVIVVGIKFAMGQCSTNEYSGPLFIKSVSFDPPVTIHPSSPHDPLPDIFSPTNQIGISNRAFYLNGKRWFIVGGNWRGLEYGQNFGATAWYPFGNGVSRHTNYFNSYHQLFQDAGVKVVRVGLVEDGRVVLDINGNVVTNGGYDAVFKRDVTNLLELAKTHDLKVEFMLVDYLVAGSPANVNGVWVRGRGIIITNPAVTQGFITNFVQPFLRDFGSHPALYSIDIINEPEWLISTNEGGCWDCVDPSVRSPIPIPLSDLRSFVTNCIAAVKTEAPHLLVTVGVSSKFAYLVAGLPLDYYALHHYNNFGELAPYLTNVPPDRTWVLEEYPTDGTNMPSHYLQLAKDLGAAGALLWNLRPDADDRTYTLTNRDLILADLRKWVLSNPCLTLPGVPSVCVALSASKEVTNIVFRWPTNAPGFTLQWVTNLTTTNWSNATPLPVIVNGQYTVTNNVTNKLKFFRLQK